MQRLNLNKQRVAKPIHKHWQFCVGGEHAAVAMRADYAKQLKYVHDELGIKYVRFHGIFNDDMHTLPALDEILPIPGVGHIRERSFYHCGVAYDNVLAAGMKPYVELSFMPEAFAKTHGGQSKIFYGSNFSQPLDYDAWAEHVTEFLKFLIHRYGVAEVESWFFEVWNEPDLKGAFFLGTQEEYFKLYEVTARAVKAVDEKLRIGGPVTSGSRWIEEFVRFCEENDVPLDFISTHQYAGDPLTGVSEADAAGGEKKVDAEGEAGEITPEMQKLGQAAQMFADMPAGTSHLDIMRMIMGEPSEKEDIPNDRFRKNSKMVKEQAKGLPVFYTEWNFSAVLTDYGNDTRKAAAYVVKTILDVEKNINESSLWCFSDIFEEMHQFTEEFHGGFGLQTIHGIPKPTFYAMKMLAELEDARIDIGEDATDHEIGVAAFESAEKLQFLLFRQKMKQREEEPEEIQISVALEKVPQRITLKRIDAVHCNPLAVWERMGKPKDLNPMETAEIISQSELKEETVSYESDGENLLVKEALGVNDIYMITIYK